MVTTDIPAAVRAEVHARDNGTCRFCGSHTNFSGHLHHIDYRSQGGQHVASNLVTLHGRCHDKVHSRKALFQPLLREVVKHDGLCALQLLRWARAQEAKVERAGRQRSLAGLR